MTQLWKPIDDLPDNWETLESAELKSLSPIWLQQRETQLKDTTTLNEFNKRLGREWAIETGIIEGLYTIDRGTTQILIERGIIESLVPHYATNRPASRVIAILKDHEIALEGVFDFVQHRRSLSPSYVKEVHAALTRNQPLTEAIDSQNRRVEVEMVRGDWKRLPNSPTRVDGTLHEYCPPEHVAAEMDRLVSMHHEHDGNHVSPEVEAAWLHHRFTQIHPFQDGNGRVARVLASLIFLRVGWFPLVIDRDTRTDYIQALEDADKGDLQSLVMLFANVQKKALLRALSLLENVVERTSATEQLFAAIHDRLAARRQAKREEWEKVFTIVTTLEESAFEKFRSMRDQLEIEFREDTEGYTVSHYRSSPETSHYFRTQIISTARELGYFADTKKYRSWVRLRIKEERQVDLVLSFHSFGYEFIGLMAATAFIEFRERGEDEEFVVQGPYNLCKDVFQYAYNEESQSVNKRFQEWLEYVTLTGLDEWRRQL